MTMKSSTLDKTCFLNVDLDICSSSNLQPLVDALGKEVIEMFVGRVRRTYEAHLELAWQRRQTPTSIILGFCKLIERLPASKRKLWTSAKLKSFDIGIQGPAHYHHFWIAVSPEAVRAAAKLGAQIAITAYGPMKTIKTIGKTPKPAKSLR
jgi:hypothetical protein